jgi:hypothetical protein
MLSSAVAFACAGLVHADGLEAESSAQEAIIDRAGERTTVTYSVTWEGDAPDFGWIIPVPGAFVELADADADRFDALRAETAPLVWSEASVVSQGCSCGPTMKAGGARDAYNVADSVTVIADGFTGTYDYVVLQADDPGAITTWLGDNGWSDGGETGVLDVYGSEGILTIAALRLEPGAGDGTLPPVSVAYDGGDARFPSRLGQLAMGPILSTTVWVLDDMATRVDGWASEDLTFIPGGTDDEPAELLLQELEGLSATQATYARTAVLSHEGRIVSRFDTRAAPGLHTTDAVFVADPGAREFVLELELAPGRNAAIWLLPLLGLPFVWRRRR